MEYPGYYTLALEDVVLAGRSNFGYEESTSFTVVSSSATTAATAFEDLVEEVESLDDVTQDMASSITIDNSSETDHERRRPVTYSNPERPSLMMTATTNPPTSATSLTPRKPIIDIDSGLPTPTPTAIKPIIDICSGLATPSQMTWKRS